MNSNDTLLCHLIATDEMHRESTPKLKTDHILHNPKQISVGTNEIVYLHFIYCADSDFEITVTTPTTVLALNPNSTIFGSNNTIVKALGNVHFKTATPVNFFVQYMRVTY